MPDFIEVYGLEDYDTSVYAFEHITQFVTCEFGVRPFLLKYETKMLAQMLKWSNHPHAMVRRLASEGCRPRLPWGMGVPSLKLDPKPILPILENLKNDSSETVRRSVANNLNDISKEHPDLLISIVKKWKKKQSAEMDKLTKHASRTLLKQGITEVMEIFGFGSVKKIGIEDFEILTPSVSIGSSLEFSFSLLNHSDKKALLRLEYGVYYLKANGTLSRKVFKISEKFYKENSKTSIQKKQSFKVITTKKFYVGKHELSLIVNGKEMGILDFILTE